ncbi:hypothetical protein CSUI_002712 [Cystoisospora suis]|uniref:Secreted protein n=1 Tax=Cystoisospora suis TaxID=483139 RepID=A0A2C6L713_9APIC|nr:hypothetical protein CSUI_002712 [Cystoisospora suis]
MFKFVHVFATCSLSRLFSLWLPCTGISHLFPCATATWACQAASFLAMFPVFASEPIWFAEVCCAEHVLRRPGTPVTSRSMQGFCFVFSGDSFAGLPFPSLHQCFQASLR